MKIKEFDYALPSALIAQYPPPQRGQSRLMVLRRSTGEIEHRNFQDLPSYLRSGDLLVTNNTRVIPARLLGHRETGGKCEVLLIPSQKPTNGVWEALVRNSGRLKPGRRILFGDSCYGIIEELKGGRAKICFPDEDSVVERLQQIGRIPLPPYIKREDEPLDRDRYQTVFAKVDGSIASPTAGLHFTEVLLRSCRGQGTDITSLTLHVGLGTFCPVRSEEIEEHTMESEWIELSEETKNRIEATKRRGGRVIAVGTTTTRALESFIDPEGRTRSGCGSTALFIRPPFHFRVIDGLITNFHLPKSTLVMLVAAFAGKDFLMKAYREAIEKKYRFYSYGDAMLIL